MTAAARRTGEQVGSDRERVRPAAALLAAGALVTGAVTSGALAAAAVAARRRDRAHLHRVRADLDQQVEELRAAWELAEASQRRFRDVFADSPVGIGLADENGEFVEVNGALCRLIGRTPDEVLGRSSREWTHPDDLAAHAHATRLITTAQAGVAQVEKRYVRPDGTVVWAWLTMSHVPGPDGRTWTLAHFQDVTSRRQADLELLHSRAVLEAAQAVAQCGLAGTDPRQVAVDRLRALVEALTVVLVERVGDDLVATACSGGVDVTGARVPVTDTSLTALGWRSGERVFAPDLRTDPRANPALAELTGTMATLCEPVLSGGEVVAELVVGWSHTVDELDVARLSAAAAMAAETGSALTAERLRAQLEEQARTDPLTGLLNRRGWLHDVRLLLAEARRREESVAVVMVDLDHFKAYNDSRGHDRGDALLTAFADVLRSHLREVDVVGRWGGEEFVLAMPACGVHDALVATGRLREAVPDGQTASFGVTVCTGDDDLEEVLRVADAALYEAKSSGRDRVVTSR